MCIYGNINLGEWTRAHNYGWRCWTIVDLRIDDVDKGTHRRIPMHQYVASNQHAQWALSGETIWYHKHDQLSSTAHEPYLAPVAKRVQPMGGMWFIFQPQGEFQAPRWHCSVDTGKRLVLSLNLIHICLIDNVLLQWLIDNVFCRCCSCRDHSINNAWKPCWSPRSAQL